MSVRTHVVYLKGEYHDFEILDLCRERRNPRLSMTISEFKLWGLRVKDALRERDLTNRNIDMMARYTALTTPGNPPGDDVKDPKP